MSALKDICDRFPWISSCQEKDAAPITASPSNLYLPGNQNLEPQQQAPSQDYCQKYSQNFNNYCSSNAKDGVINNFCHIYKKKCLQFLDADQSSFTTPKPSSQTAPTLEEIKHYCNLYKTDYLNLCINTPIRSDAEVFCSGYNNICPGSPNPGSVYPTNGGGQPKKKPSQASGLSNDQQSANPFPVDGDIGNMLGIPSGGGGPVEGLGGLNNMHIPSFGGPVDGGLGFGRSVFAPFFGGNKGFNVVPTKSFTQGENYNFAGMSAGGMSGVDWSGTPGLNMINRGLGIGENSPNRNRASGLPGFGKKKRR